MTISTSASSQIFLGNGSTTAFDFSFIANSANDIEVIYTDSTGTPTLLSSSQYTLTLNPAATGQLWGIGGTVTYTVSGSPIASGTSLTVSRILPLVQTITISNQGDFAPQVTEEALDTLEMQIQQVAARTGQIRGVWATGVDYGFGDVVQDGVNGANSSNYYMCAIANTSGTWSTDLAAGDWSLVIQSTIPATSLPLSIGNGGTGSTTASAARIALGLGTMATQAASAVAITGGTISADYFTPIGTSIPSTAKGIYSPGTNIISIATASTLRASVEASGRFLVAGTSVAQAMSDCTPMAQILRNDLDAAAVIGRYQVTANPPKLYFYKSRGTLGNHGVIVTGDILASIKPHGDDGVNLPVLSGEIRCTSTDTIAANQIPCKWEFYTSGTTGVLTLAMTIDSSQNTTLAGNMISSAAAKGLVLKRGSNGKVGTFTLTGATPVTVSNTSVATSDIVCISLNTVGGTVGSQPSLKTLTAGANFTVSGTSGDVSVYNYSITSSLV